MAFFFVEITDTFGGEANYSWVTRHKVKATSHRGAMVKIGRASGISFRKVDAHGDSLRYDSKSGGTCAFIESWDEERHASYTNVSTDIA